MAKKPKAAEAKAAKSWEWKKGPGKLGPLAPLLGAWMSGAIETPMGKMGCARTFSPVGSGKSWVRLEAVWNLGAHGSYVEQAIFGAKDDGKLGFWSFTSDGKRSEGTVAEAPDIHPKAIAFEAQMPAGLARMAYWPDATEGFRFAVEARNKSGWKRFQEHHYKPVTPAK